MEICSEVNKMMKMHLVSLNYTLTIAKKDKAYVYFITMKTKIKLKYGCNVQINKNHAKIIEEEDFQKYLIGRFHGHLNCSFPLVKYLVLVQAPSFLFLFFIY